MIDFKTVQKSDVNNFKKYYDYSSPSAIGTEWNLLNAYMWRNEFNIKFAVYDDTLIRAYFNDDEKIWGYTMPVGKNIKGALNEIMGDSAERGAAPHIVMLTNAQRAMLESMYPSGFSYERSPENQDYIYLTEEFATLPGKKFHAKRNHISKFYRTYTDTHFETLDDSNKADAMQVVLDWCRENGVNADNYEEAKIIREALFDLREEFNMRGAVLYADTKPIAMTLGSEISPIAFDINFEKALREYDGVYAVISNEFAKTLTSYKYINREEDMGIEGLRKSKLSYNPVIILDRFNARLK